MLLSCYGENIDVSDEHVITVGGSGDFAKIFLEKGATKVDIFDLSLPAVFSNELSITALQELDFQSCKDFVNFWQMKREKDGRQHRANDLAIFDERIYGALKPFFV